MGVEKINGRGKKKKQSSDSHCVTYFFFSVIVDFAVILWIITVQLEKTSHHNYM